MTIIGGANTPEEKKLLDRYIHMENEKIWRRQVLDSIEPNMTSQRADELKIEQQVKLLDECYQITMDGVPVGPTYPMPPGMLTALMWGDAGIPKYKMELEPSIVTIEDSKWTVDTTEWCGNEASILEDLPGRTVYLKGQPQTYRITAVSEFTQPDPQTVMHIQVEPCEDSTIYTDWDKPSTEDIKEEI